MSALESFFAELYSVFSLPGAFLFGRSKQKTLDAFSVRGIDLPVVGEVLKKQPPPPPPPPRRAEVVPGVRPHIVKKNGGGGEGFAARAAKRGPQPYTAKIRIA